jgi:hypothetical protein
MPLRGRRTPATASRLSLLIVPALVLGAVALPSTAAVAAPSPSASAVPEGLDYATSLFSDAVDFSNREDLKTENGPTAKLSAASWSGGKLSFTITGNGYISPVWGGYPGSLFLDRDGSRSGQQIATGAYRRLSMRVYASRATSAGFMWFTCPGLSGTCEGGMPFSLKAGWNTYDVALVNKAYGLPKAWSGAVHGLRLALNGASTGTSFTFDWMRLYQPGTSGSVNGTGSSMLVTNGTDTYSVPCDDGTTCTRDLGMLPPGTYQFADPGSPSDWSSSVRVLARPRTVVLNPSDAGCGDWASRYRAGNRWDMNQLADLKKKVNTTGGVSGGAFVGTNAAPKINDPALSLTLPRTIDGRYYRRITFTYGYDGPFNLADVKGGGTMARVMWQSTRYGTTWMQTADIVTYSGIRTYTVDLGAAGVNESNATARYPITASSAVTALRFDPNEDRGARRWRLYDVRLAANCSVARGHAFGIQWRDGSYAAGTTASVYVVRSATPRTSGGTLVGTVAEAAGTNTMSWTPSAGLATGTYWVYVVANNGGATSVHPASGPLVVT